MVNINVKDDTLEYTCEIRGSDISDILSKNKCKILAEVLNAGYIKVGAIDKNTIMIIQSREELNYSYYDKMNRMSGETFETMCADLLKRNGFQNISLTRATGDYGVDILAEKDSVKYAIQCKRYNQPVGNKAVQEAYSGKKYYNCHVAVVLTNSVFTDNAKELAESNGVLLWDKDKLDELLMVLV